MRDQALHQSRWPLSFSTTAALLGAGLMQAISLAWPFKGDFQGQSQGWLQILALIVLSVFLDRARSKAQACAAGWIFSFAWLAASIWWLFISMHRYGGLTAPLAALAVGLLAAGLAILYSLACFVFHVASQKGVGILLRASAFAAVWMLAEIVRGTLWTGFPWAAVGYAHIDSVLRHWAPWIGVYGLCAVSAFIAMAIGAERRREEKMLRFTQGMVVAVFATSVYTWFTAPSQLAQEPSSTDAGITVTLLQGNISQDLKFGEGVNQALNDYREALMSSDSDLTVTPETAIPLIRQQLPQHYWDALEAHFGKKSQLALIGQPLARQSELGVFHYSNSVVALMSQSTPASTAYYQYDKHHLVPFGEFVPPLFQWFVRLMNIPLGEFSRGDLVQPSLDFKGERIAPNICYEDLFGEELARRFADSELAPTVLVNLSNIAWFGDTVAIDQHLNISRMRALELGRPMLRATNTGATAVIDAQGQVTARLPYSVKGKLTAKVYGVHGPVTPYARWVSMWGLWPLVMLALLVLAIAFSITHASRHGQRRFGP